MSVSVAQAPRDPRVREALERLAEIMAGQILAEIRGGRSGNIEGGTSCEPGRAL